MYLFYKLREVTKQLDEVNKTHAHVSDLATHLSASLKTVDGLKHQMTGGCNPDQVRDIVFSVITSEQGISEIRSRVYAQEEQDNTEIIKMMMPPPTLFGAATAVDPQLMQAFLASTQKPSAPQVATITEITSDDEDVQASEAAEEQADDATEQAEAKEVSFGDIDFDQINKLASSLFSGKATDE